MAWSGRMELSQTRPTASSKRNAMRGAPIAIPAYFEVELDARLVTSPARPGGRGGVDLTYAEEGHEDHFNRRVRGHAPTSELEKL